MRTVVATVGHLMVVQSLAAAVERAISGNNYGSIVGPLTLAASVGAIAVSYATTGVVRGFCVNHWPRANLQHLLVVRTFFAILQQRMVKPTTATAIGWTPMD